MPPRSPWGCRLPFPPRLPPTRPSPGADASTVGGLHPMIDNDLRLRRLRQEAADPETAVILLDVVLGEGAHADPASELAPALAEALGRPGLTVVVVLVGTQEDPQGPASQRE